MNIVFYEASGASKNAFLKRIAASIGCRFKTYQEFLNEGLTDAAYHVVQGILGPSSHIIKEVQRKNKNLIYIDYGYFRGRAGRHSRNTWFRVHVNSFHAKNWYDWNKSRRTNYRKYDRLHLPRFKDWRTQGNHILVCPPTPAVSEFFHQQQWLNKVMIDLKKYTNRPIIVRHKPRAVNVHWEGQMLLNSMTHTEHQEEAPLIDQLQNCWAMVTFNSVTAIDGVLAGVPVFSGTECITHLLGNTELSNIEQPVLNAQAPFLWSAAEFQYSKSELMSSAVWQDIIRQSR